jgi:uroporphyrinogen-III synthase
MAETVVVTASQGSFPELVQALKGTGVDVEEYPLISFTDPLHWAPVDDALGRLSSYGAVAITSPRAAAAVAGRMELRQKARREGAPPPVWATGPATADALGDVLGPVRTPTKPSAESGAAAALALAMLEAKVAGPVLFPCGEKRRAELPDLLRRHGIEVDEVVCYRSVLASQSDAHAAAMRATMVVVASPSVADLLVRACPTGSRPDLLAVGPTTASSAQASGWSPAAVAAEPTAEAVTAAVRHVLAKRSSHE